MSCNQEENIDNTENIDDIEQKMSFLDSFLSVDDKKDSSQCDEYEMNKNKYELCNKKDIVSDGKYVKCLTMKSPDWNEYLIEPIEVE